MTKRVRIENADNNNDHKLIVDTWVKGQNGEPDRLVKSENLDHPTDLCDAMVWEGQYVVVREA